MVGHNAHGDVGLFLFGRNLRMFWILWQILHARELLNGVDERLEDIGVVVAGLALKGTDETLKAHARINNLGGKGSEGAVGTTVVLHEDDVPNLYDLRMILVDERGAGDSSLLGGGAAVHVDFGAGAARTGVAHLPEVVVLVSVEDMVFRQVAFPETGCLVVALDAFGGAAFENGGVEVGRVKVKHINEIFPCPVDGLFFEVVAERPVAEHFEHGVVIGVVADLFQVVMLATGTEAFLRVGYAAILWYGIAEDDVFELVHARIGEHERGVVLDNHGCRRHNLMSF